MALSREVTGVAGTNLLLVSDDQAVIDTVFAVALPPTTYLRVATGFPVAASTGALAAADAVLVGPDVLQAAADYKVAHPCLISVPVTAGIDWALTRLAGFSFTAQLPAAGSWLATDEWRQPPAPTGIRRPGPCHDCATTTAVHGHGCAAAWLFGRPRGRAADVCACSGCRTQVRPGRCARCDGTATVDSAPAVARLADLSARLNLTAEDLDDLVYDLTNDEAANAYNAGAGNGTDEEAYEELHDQADAAASGVNNGGLTAQLRLLLTAFTEADLADRLRDLSVDHGASAA
ncbi:hypothetical protein [Micromonospora aurantiaca (nom. illeg.)]|uniref:hypothetical protein n=1 Tax=Micromonospora aurantiaca (nom. illeg.) TaxID=47850 RepID=UPI00340571BD